MSWSDLHFRTAGLVGSLTIRLLGHSLLWKVQGEEHYQAFRREGRPIVFVFWHAWILPLAYRHRDEQVAVLSSRHADGEYIARTILRMGFRSVRGSSSRGGAQGLRRLLREGRKGHDLAFTPDGPRGPARVFKPGALVAAQLLGAPVIPVSVQTDRAWRLNSWDRFVIPKPLTRIQISYGHPRFIPRTADRHALEEHARDLERILEEGEVTR